MRKFSMRHLRVSGLILLLYSCQSEPDKLQIEPVVFVSDTTYISPNAAPELSAEVVSIMEQMDMCAQLDTSNRLAPCTNQYFRVFRYRPDRPLKEGFIVEMSPQLSPYRLPQLVIVHLSENRMVVTNQYLGDLLEMRTTPEGYNDLLIRYEDKEAGLVTIRHEWQGSRYDVVDVEEINNRFVRPEFKDTVNKSLLPFFSAGY